MNSCILMAEVIQEAQLRYTSDNQTPITELWVQFPGQRDEDPPERLRVVGWGNLAQEMENSGYQVGDRLIVEGRLTINSVDRPEGFKEKRVELTASRIHRIAADASVTSSAPVAAPTAAAKPAPSAAPTAAAKPAPSRSKPVASEAPAAKTPAYTAGGGETADFDDIPF
jgi:single-strand DNA-binding protein